MSKNTLEERPTQKYDEGEKVGDHQEKVMKSGWQIMTLSEVATVFDGPHATPKTVDTGPIFLGISALQDGVINLGETRHVTEDDFKQWTRRVKPQTDDIVFSYETRLGQAAIIPEGLDCCLGRRMGLVRFRKEIVYPRFFLWQYLSPSFREFLDSRTIRGATVDRISIKEFPTFQIAVPPLPEQKRIVAILDKAFAAIAQAKAKAEQNRQNACALFESHLQSVFMRCDEGWERVRIEDTCDSIMDCVNKTAPKVDEPTPFKMIRTTNVKKGYVNLDNVNYVTEDVYRIWTRRQTPQLGDVILTREAPMGEVGMLMTDDKVFLGQRLVSYRANPKKLNNRFLLYALQSGNLQGQIHALASGSTVQHMRVPDSKNLQLPLPSLREQEMTVATLDYLREQTQHLEALYQRKIAALDELKQALLHQAFSGQL